MMINSRLQGLMTIEETTNATNLLRIKNLILATIELLKPLKEIEVNYA